MDLCRIKYGLISKLCWSLVTGNILNRLRKSANFKLLYLDAQNSKFSSTYCVWNLIWNSYYVINFRGWFTFYEFFRISKHCWNTKTGSVLSSWNCNFELKFECFLVGILEKCLLGSFSTLKQDFQRYKIFQFWTYGVQDMIF